MCIRDSCHTALAEAEIEYSDEVSPSIYVKFKLDATPGVFEASGAEGDAYLLIWTTTPWTLPANTAVSLAPDADYVMVTVGGDNLIMAKELDVYKRQVFAHALGVLSHRDAAQNAP